jgi:hypothetical protein
MKERNEHLSAVKKQYFLIPKYVFLVTVLLNCAPAVCKTVDPLCMVDNLQKIIVKTNEDFVEFPDQIPENLNSNYNGKTGKIDMIPTESLGKRGGFANSGLYRVKRNGTSRIIKTFVYSGDSSASEIALEKAKAQRVYEALLWAQDNKDAPKLYRAGKINLKRFQVAANSFRPAHEENFLGYFIEMEEKFPDQSTVFFKQGTGFGASREFFVEGSPRTTQAIANLFISAFEHHFVPIQDTQFLMVKGKAAWIDLDSNYWKKITPNNFQDDDFAGLDGVLRDFKYRNHQWHTFQNDLLAAIRKSTKLTKVEKNSLTKMVKNASKPFDGWLYK